MWIKADKKEVIGLGSSEKMAAYLKKAAAQQDNMDTDRICVSRLTMLFDPDSFVSLDNKVVSRPFSAAFDRPPVEGDGVVTGYGTIGGRLVFAASQDADVYGGSISRAHAMKIVKVLEMAVSSGAPFIAVYSSGGARIEEGVLALEGMGALLSALNEAKGVIPLISVVLGNCPGGLAIAAAASDFLFFGGEKARMFMNSPVLTAAGSDGSVLASGIGTPDIHMKDTGLAAFVLPDEESCLFKVREILDYVPVNTGDTLVFTRETVTFDDANRTSDTLNDMAAAADEAGLDIKAVFSEVSDLGAFLEVWDGYGTDIVTAFAKLDGISVGLIGNSSSRISGEGAKKAAKLVRFCSEFMIPIITFTNSEGFVIGVEAEKTGMLEAAGDLIAAFAGSDVPRIGVITGKAIGTAYLAMNSKMLGADMVFAWPTAEVAVLNADTAANILYKGEIAASEDPAALRAEKVKEYREQISDPETAAGYGQVDELIIPSATRPRIISALDILLCAYPLIETEINE